VELVPAGPVDVKADPWQRLVAIGSILSVLFVAIGLYVTNEANRKSNEANREQHRLTAEGQITDRFTKAVEQLGQPGPEKVDVRLGAIHALGRIMRDSAADQPAVINVLAAFIQVHSPAPKMAHPQAEPPLPPIDIQTAATVLGYRDSTRDSIIAIEEGPWSYRPDLSRTNLTRANLYKAALNRATLTDALLIRANLIRANLTDALLNRANLTEAKLTGANLTGADLTRADLFYTDLRGADLTGADLTGAKLFSADLRGADLTDADLTDAFLVCVKTDEHTRLPSGVARPAPCDID
jgi:hypothetical protein